MVVSKQGNGTVVSTDPAGFSTHRPLLIPTTQTLGPPWPGPRSRSPDRQGSSASGVLPAGINGVAH